MSHMPYAICHITKKKPVNFNIVCNSFTLQLITNQLQRITEIKYKNYKNKVSETRYSKRIYIGHFKVFVSL